MRPPDDSGLPQSLRELVERALGPWGGPAAAIDAYEAATRAAADAQLACARVVDLQPARALIVLSADLTRDVGAVQVSSARWLLDA
jgi:hypothetical protein